jgi:hypothetical protein
MDIEGPSAAAGEAGGLSETQGVESRPEGWVACRFCNEKDARRGTAKKRRPALNAKMQLSEAEATAVTVINESRTKMCTVCADRIRRAGLRAAKAIGPATVPSGGQYQHTSRHSSLFSASFPGVSCRCCRWLVPLQCTSDMLTSRAVCPGGAKDVAGKCPAETSTPPSQSGSAGSSPQDSSHQQSAQKRPAPEEQSESDTVSRLCISDSAAPAAAMIIIIKTMYLLTHHFWLAGSKADSSRYTGCSQRICRPQIPRGE